MSGFHRSFRWFLCRSLLGKGFLRSLLFGPRLTATAARTLTLRLGCLSIAFPGLLRLGFLSLGIGTSFRLGLGAFLRERRGATAPATCRTLRLAALFSLVLGLDSLLPFLGLGLVLELLDWEWLKQVALGAALFTVGPLGVSPARAFLRSFGLRVGTFARSLRGTTTSTATSATTTATTPRGRLILLAGLLFSIEVNLTELARGRRILERDFLFGLGSEHILIRRQCVTARIASRLLSEEHADEVIDIGERQQGHLEHVGSACTRGGIRRTDQQQAAADAVDAEDLHQATEAGAVVLPVAGLALQPEELVTDGSHQVRFELAAIRKHTLDVVEHLELGRAHGRTQALRQHRGDVDLEPTPGQELADLAILGGDHAQLFLRRTVVVEILEHAVAMQQGSELHRCGTRSLRVVVDVDPLTTPGGHTALDLLVELGEQIEVRAEVPREMLESLVAVEIILTLVDHDAAGLEVVDEQTHRRIVRRGFRQGPALGLIPTPSLAVALLITISIAISGGSAAASAATSAPTSGGITSPWSSTSPLTEGLSEEFDFVF